MTASILTALPICVAVQHMDWTAIGHALVFGFHCADARRTADRWWRNRFNGQSDANRMHFIVIVSGIFQETELLDGAHRMVASLARHISVFGATLVTSLVASAVACNQTLSIMLTNQLCDHLESDEYLQGHQSGGYRRGGGSADSMVHRRSGAARFGGSAHVQFDIGSVLYLPSIAQPDFSIVGTALKSSLSAPYRCPNRPEHLRHVIDFCKHGGLA